MLKAFKRSELFVTNGESNHFTDKENSSLSMSDYFSCMKNCITTK